MQPDCVSNLQCAARLSCVTFTFLTLQSCGSMWEPHVPALFHHLPSSLGVYSQNPSAWLDFGGCITSGWLGSLFPFSVLTLPPSTDWQGPPSTRHHLVWCFLSRVPRYSPPTRSWRHAAVMRRRRKAVQIRITTLANPERANEALCLRRTVSSVFAMRALSSTATTFTHRTVDTGTAVSTCLMLINDLKWQIKNGKRKEDGMHGASLSLLKQELNSWCLSVTSQCLFVAHVIHKM